MRRIKIIITVCILMIILFDAYNSISQAKANLFNMSYLFFGGPNTYVKQVDDTKGSLHVVAPNYFDISKEGELVINWTLKTSFIDEMHRRGIKVVPFLANHWNYEAGANGLQNREKLARAIADAIRLYKLDGVNVDIEGIGRTGTYRGEQRNFRDEHTDFIRLLREYLPKDKEVSVAVAGNPNNWQTGWHGFYDYKGLSEYVDYLMIMAYDEGWESPDSPIGPVSSLSFFERSITYAIHSGVPRNKIVIGLPFYGRMWKLDGPTLNGIFVTGRGLSSTRVDPLVKQFNGTYHYDEIQQSPYVTFTIPKGQSTFVGSLELTEGNYIIWYENERSIKAKLRLPMKYQIRGTGSWALMHETIATWDYYSRWLNGKFFADVHPGFWAEESILFVSDHGWMSGVASTIFSPNNKLTRAQGAVILVRAMGYVNETPSSYQFADTKNHWAEREIELARELGIIHGIGDNRYAPQDPLTREQLATILRNIFAYENSLEQSPFPDVPSERWSSDSILAIFQKGFLTGFEDGTFRPTETSTRAQMAALMERMSSEFQQYSER